MYSIFRNNKFLDGSLDFGQARQEILTRYDEKNINVHFSSFPAAFHKELENAYISRIMQLRRDSQLPRVIGKETSIPITRHYIFSGRPGTGKSTAARLLGYFYAELGITEKDTFIEVSRASLIGSAIGQTEQKITRLLQEAKGGVLFVNEAHQLFHDDSKDFGKIAIQEMMKFMEDHRDKIIVIIDGIPEFINEFLKMYPGLRDRFSRKIEFPDLDTTTLVNISNILLEEYQYHFTEEARAKFHQLITGVRKKYQQRPEEEFANIRTARNFLELIIDEQCKRLYQQNSISDDEFQTLITEDVDKVSQYYLGEPHES